jgi:hypothetical protein
MATMNELPGSRPIGPAELEVARGTWRRVRRPGVVYVDVGRLPDGVIELIGTDAVALDAIAAALVAPGTPVRRTQLPHPTERDIAALFKQANELPPYSQPALPAHEDSTGLWLGLIGGGIALAIGIKVLSHRR